jgi:hypothetical protein
MTARAARQQPVRQAAPRVAAHDREPALLHAPPDASFRIGELHRAIGNQAVGRLLLQRKLVVNQPGDVYEREADRVADAVMRASQLSASSAVSRAMPAPRALQRACSCGGTCADCRQKEEKLQRKEASAITVAGAGAGAAAPPIVHEVLRSTGQPLDAKTRSFMEPRFGRSFADVRIHADTQAAESARSVSARAYTAGGDVVFAAGQYTPDTSAGRRLLAHELAHVVQQRGSIGTSPALVQRQVVDPLDVIEGYTDETVTEMVVDRASKRVQLRTFGHAVLEGRLESISASLTEGQYLLERSFGPDPLRTWNIFKGDGSKLFGGMMFEISIPNVSFESLSFHKRTRLYLGSQGLDDLGRMTPLNKKYDEVKYESTYIDNFKSASYDPFRREIHLVFDNGHEIAIPLSTIDRAPLDAPVEPQAQERVKALAERHNITLPSVEGGKPGQVASFGLRPEDTFYRDDVNQTIRPRRLHSRVTPRLHEAIKDIDPDTSDLLFQAALAFAAGPPMPEGSEYLALIPIGVKGGLAVKNSIARALEQKAAGRFANVPIHPPGPVEPLKPSELEHAQPGVAAPAVHPAPPVAEHLPPSVPTPVTGGATSGPKTPVQVAQDLMAGYPGRLTDTGGGLARIIERARHPTLRVDGRAAAAELGAVIRVLENGIDGKAVARVEVVPSSSAGRTPDLVVHFTDGTTTRYEIRTLTSAPVGYLTTTPKSGATPKTGPGAHARSLAEKTAERPVTVSRIKQAIIDKARVTSTRPSQLTAPLPGVAPGGTIAVNITAADVTLQMIDTAVQQLPSLGAHVERIDVSYLGPRASTSDPLTRVTATYAQQPSGTYVRTTP